MPAKWTGEIVKQLHLNRLSQTDLAVKLGVSREYVCLVLNGKRTPADAKERFTEALDALIKEARA